ncbi:MAG: hypothetical protein K2W33_15930 [Burkholderiales bacterium]|nr:hypothetical protein [Burkholderiales bacterium]
MSGCGGGDSYEPTTPITPTVDNFPTIVNTESGALMRRGQNVNAATGSLVGPEYGDTWMYQWINKTTGTGYYTTHFLSALEKTTQLYANTVTYSDTQPFEVWDFGSRNQTVTRSFENTRCQYSPQVRSPFPRRPFAVGNTWTYVWDETCLNGTVVNTVKKTIAGRVVGLETKTLGLLGQGGVALGGTTQRTFQTARYTATRTETAQAGTWTYADTCWHDMAQDRTVQCDTTASFVPAGGAAVTQVYEQSQTLAFVREVRTPSPVLITDGPTTVAMYAGRWDFRLVGTGGSVTCANMVFSLTGNISGDCEKVTVTQVNQPGSSLQVPVEVLSAFKVSGFVDRRSQTSTGGTATTRWIDAINVVADSNPSEFSLTGEMLSPISASGTWLKTCTTCGQALSGTFAAKHR